MLTSLYYYQHYAPYMINPVYKRIGGSAAPKKKELIGENNDAQAEVALNKSLNREIVKYAKGIYKNTTDLKYTSKKLETDISNYSKYKDFEEFDKDVFERSFNHDLEQFSGSYNESLKFLKSQPHSPFLKDAAEKLENITDNSGKILSVMGINKDENGNLAVNSEENTFWNGENIDKKTEAAKRLFSGVHDNTTEILNNPMAKHMNFKSLNYYYNYKVDKVRVDSFQIVKTGLLVNLAL